MAEYHRLPHTVLDTTRPRELAEFYRHLLSLRYRPGDEPPRTGHLTRRIGSCSWTPAGCASSLSSRSITLPRTT